MKHWHLSLLLYLEFQWIIINKYWRQLRNLLTSRLTKASPWGHRTFMISFSVQSFSPGLGSNVSITMSPMALLPMCWCSTAALSRSLLPLKVCLATPRAFSCSSSSDMPSTEHDKHPLLWRIMHPAGREIHLTVFFSCWSQHQMHVTIAT